MTSQHSAAELDVFRTGCALVEEPHGLLLLRGKGTLDFAHRMSTNALKSLAQGHGAYTCFLTPKGRILDYVLALAEIGDVPELLLVGSDAWRAKLDAHLQRSIFFNDETELTDISARWRVLTLYGPRASEVASTRADEGAWHEVALDGVRARVATGATFGEGRAYLVLALTEDVERVRAEVVARGAVPVSAATWRLARVQAGQPSAPEDLNEDVNPWEIGLGATIAFNKGCYVGQEVVARLDAYDKVQRARARVRAEWPLPGDAPVRLAATCAGEDAGWVTSPTPTSDGWCGIGCLRRTAVDGTAPILVNGAPIITNP